MTHVYQPDNLDNVRVVSHEGRIVCSVGIRSTSVRTPRGAVRVGGVNAVATHPDHRRHGLASVTMTDACNRMRATDHHIGLLSTRVPDWCRKLDWECAGHRFEFTFDRGNIERLPRSADLEIGTDWRAHVPALCGLYATHVVGAERTPDMFALLAERKVWSIFVGFRGGAAVAYVAASGANVKEYGGSPVDVASLLQAAFTAADNPNAHTSERAPGQRSTIEMNVTAPAATNPVADLLLRLGIPHGLRYDGMIKIINVMALFAALHLLDDIDLTEHDGGWTLSWHGERLDFSERELVKLVFGPERFPDFAPDLFPVPFFQWPFDHV